MGGLTPQAAQIQEVIAMLGSMSEGQLQTVQQHMQDRFVTMQQRRGVPEEFGDGLFFGSAPVALRRVALETPEWASRDSNHHRQSVSDGKTNAIPTEPSGRLEVFGDGLGRAADSSFVTPQPFDVLPGFGVQQSNHGNSHTIGCLRQKRRNLEDKRRRGVRLGWLFG